jgi:hypothetical protein
MTPPIKPSSFAVPHAKPTIHETEGAQIATATGAFLQKYSTRVWVYLNHTGDDAGSTSEIHSEIYFDDATNALGYIEISNNTDFSGDNGGLGKLLVTKEAISRGFGKRFRATAYEEGNISTPNRMIVDGTIDFESGPDGYMSGQVFNWGPFSNSSDGNYKGFIQFQCSPISS